MRTTTTYGRHRACDVATRSQHIRRIDLACGGVFVLVALTLLAVDVPTTEIYNGKVYRPIDAISYAVVIGQSLPLVAHRRFPAAVFLMVWVSAMADVALDVEPNVAELGPSVAAYSLAAFVGWPMWRRTAVSLVMTGVLATAISVNFQPDLLAAMAASPLVLLTEVAPPHVLLFGVWQAFGETRRRLGRDALAQRRKAAASEARRLEAEATAAIQRRQLARELHDSIGHQVTLVVLQADALHTEETDPHRRDALADLGTSGRSALAELRELVGVLGLGTSDERAPQPTLTDLDALLAPVRSVGLPVDVRVQGAPIHLSAAVDLSACRVVQESLTNVIKHALAGSARLRVVYGVRSVFVEVLDDGAGAGYRPPGGSGLRGLRERVQLLDGRFEAGNGPGGGFRVAARFPSGAMPT